MSEGVVPVLDLDERKRLGQYFTGEPLSRLLAALGSADKAGSVIDPMAGSGDMLMAAVDVGASPATLTAIEIDPSAALLCRKRLGDLGVSAAVTTADVFSLKTWAQSSSTVWDLVITNPPYVRYQRSAQSAVGRVEIPSATEIRAGLREIVRSRTTLTPDDRMMFDALISGYSGLADLAVPSWLLCASLVAPNGRLAMVVPDTWLSRNYALPVLYLLRRCFDVEHIVEDGEATWFGDALVRTTLVVARRVPTRVSALSEETRSYAHVRLTSRAADHRSIVGALHPRSARPELVFAERMRRVARSGHQNNAPGLSATRASDGALRERLLGDGARPTWMKESEPLTGSTRRGVAVPRLLLERVGATTLRTCRLDELGWSVGQGLRTGANRFFYAGSRSVVRRGMELEGDLEWCEGTITAPSEIVRVAVRNQHDLALTAGDLETSPGRLLYLEGWALEEDIAATSAFSGTTPYRTIPSGLAAYVRRAAQGEVVFGETRRRVPELSAVVTNVRLPDARHPDRLARFWYHLPPLAPRHTGALLVPRINHRHPLAATNEAGVVIDANFSTFWPSDNSEVTPHALLAILRSSWSLVVMEASGTVLGGGALKLEATQLRRLPLPKVNAQARVELDALGRALERTNDAETIATEIDTLIWSCLGRLSRKTTRELSDLGRQLVNDRNPRPRSVGTH